MGTLDTLAGGGSTLKDVPRKVSGVDVVPYTADLDPQADKFLPWMWNKLKEDGLVELYFPGQSEFGFANFVKMFSSNDTKVLLVVTKDAEGKFDQAVGFATWQPMPLGATNAAMVGFVFLKDFWDRHVSVEAAQSIMRYWFDTSHIDVTVGAVAADNHLAQRFLLRIGWEKVGVLPAMHQYEGKQSDATLWCMTRQRFFGVQERD